MSTYSLGKGCTIRTEESIKRILSSLLIVLILVFSAGPIASAQTRRHRRHSRTFWQKHRDKITVAGATGAGAAIGGGGGGKKRGGVGAGWGARRRGRPPHKNMKGPRQQPL